MASSPPGRRRIPLRRRLAFALAVFVLLALTLEGAARLAWSEDVAALSEQNTIFRDHPTLFWTLRPNLRIQSFYGTFSTNSDGFRGPELRSPRPAGLQRVLMLGESTTMGAEVDDAEVYSQRLASLLERVDPGRWEVVNAGTGAWTTWQSAIFLTERGEELDPQVVVTWHLYNDTLPTGVVDPHNFLYAVRGTDAERYEQRRPLAPLLRLLYNSRAYLGFRRAVLLRSAALPRMQGDGGGFSERNPRPDRERALRIISNWCKAHGARLILAHPTYHIYQVRDDLLPAIAREGGHQYLDFPALRQAAGLLGPSFFVDGVHPTAAGHAFIAEQMLPAVLGTNVQEM